MIDVKHLQSKTAWANYSDSEKLALLAQAVVELQKPLDDTSSSSSAYEKLKDALEDTLEDH